MSSNEQMIESFENQYCACWDDPAMYAERAVWALAWAAASAATTGPDACDMGPICIGCTPRVGNACPGASIQANDSESK